VESLIGEVNVSALSLAEATHAPDCARCVTSGGQPLYECGGTYTCPRCDRVFGWCIGAYDDTPALCDECANVVQASDATALSLTDHAPDGPPSFTSKRSTSDHPVLLWVTRTMVFFRDGGFDRIWTTCVCAESKPSEEEIAVIRRTFGQDAVRAVRAAMPGRS